jgi:phosphatidyl-myo-inositol dimannoside synthase
MGSPPDRVLLVLPSLTGLGGGIELYLQQFLEAMAWRWPSLALDAVLAREPVLARPERLSATVRSNLTVDGARSDGRMRRIAELLARATRMALRARPTLVVCGHVNYAAVSLALARLTGARWCALTYGLEAWDVSGANAWALRAADRVIAISRFTADRLAGTAGVPRERIAIVHNAVDLARFHPGRPSPEVEHDLSALPRPRLLTLCRLDAQEQYKGVDVVIEALAQRPGLAQSYLVVGDGSDRARLEALAAERRVPCRFYGRASDAALPDLYRACDLFVMPSRREGFGYVFIEAMACGVPVVAGGIDGSVDALADGALGLLVDPTSPSAVADAIEAQLAGRTPRAMRDPTALHEGVAQHFAPEVFRGKVASALAPLLAGDQ